MVNNLDEALRILKNAVRRREPASVGLIGNAAEVLPELAQRGVLPDLLTDQTPADDLSGGYIPRGLAVADALEIQQSDPNAYRERALDSIAAQARAMLELKKLGAIVFEFGNGIRALALARGVAEAGEIPDFISEYLLGDVAQGRGLLTVMALSGDPADLAAVDAACLDLFPQSELSDWIAVARKHPTPGLPARSLWMTATEGAKLGEAINDAVRNGAIKAPVAVGRSIYAAGQLQGSRDCACAAKVECQCGRRGQRARRLASFRLPFCRPPRARRGWACRPRPDGATCTLACILPPSPRARRNRPDAWLARSQATSSRPQRFLPLESRRLSIA